MPYMHFGNFFCMYLSVQAQMDAEENGIHMHLMCVCVCVCENSRTFRIEFSSASLSAQMVKNRFSVLTGRT